MKKLLTFLTLLTLFFGVSWAAEGDLHDMGKSQSTLLNNNASIPSIEIAQQAYPIKAVTINWSYNKNISNVVTIEVKVGGESWGTKDVGGNTTADAVFEGTSTTGAVEIIFTNHAGSGTKKGTFYVNSVKLTEGAGGVELPTAEAPTFSPVGGTYNSAQTVTITSATSGATIYYTTDGEDPTTSSSSISNGGTVNISSSCTLKAMAAAEGHYNSTVSLATYTIETPTGDTEWVLTDPSDLETGDIVLIVDKSSSRAMSNDNGTGSAPSAISVTLNTDKTKVTANVTDALKWEVTNTEGTFNFTVPGGTTYLYCINSNNGVRVGTGDAKNFVMTGNGSGVDYLTCTGTTQNRYLGVYINSDWRCYTSMGGNIANTVVGFYKKNDGTTPQPSVAKPVISGETPFDETTTVTINCETEGSTVYYTIDGTEPDNTSTPYTAAFTLDASATVKAIAYVGETASQVATKEFVKNPSVANIAEMLAYEGTGEFKFTGDVVVTYFNSTNSQYVWVKDATGYSLLYNSNLSTAEPAPKTGDVIKGGWKGKKSVYNKLIEVTNVTTASIDGTQEVTPVELTLADVKEAKQATYGWLRGVTITEVNNRNFTISDGENTVPGYNTYNTDENIILPEANDGKTYDIRGIVNVHNNPQFTPVEFVEHVSDEPAYYLYGTFKMNGTAWVQGDAAYKFTDNGDGTYSLNNVMLPDNVRFKIVKMQGEDVLAEYGAANNGPDYGINADWHTNIPMDGADAYTIAAGASTNFTIYDNNGTLTFDATREAQMFIKGSYDNFASKTALTATEAGWTINKELAKDNEFGFVDEWGTWFGTTKTVNAENLGNEIDLGNSGNFKIGLDETAEYTISVNSAKNKVVITRAFAVNCSTVTDIEGKTGGTISADKETAYPGETVTLTINTNNGYTLNGVTLNGTAIEPVEGVYSFTMPQAVANVVASFTANTYTITLDNDSEMGTVTGLPETAHTGQDVSFSVTPEEGYTVTKVSASFINANNVETAVPVTENNGVYSFGMPPFDVTVKVTYKVPAAPCEIPFVETWNGTEGQGGNDNQWSGISTTTAAIADHEGWIYTRQDGAEFQGFGASACLRVGDRNEEGAATTPDIIVTNGTIYKMTFKAGSWDNNVAINFSATGATLFADEACTTPLSSLDIAYREWGEYTVYVKATSNLMNITFATPAYKRFFLDDVNIDYFATPEYTEVTLAELCQNGVTTDGSNKYVIKDRLVAVYADLTKGVLWCKDEGNASIFPTYIKEGQVDYLYNDTKAQNKRDWDQSNWIALHFTTPTSTNGIDEMLRNAQNHYIKAGTIKGTYFDEVNYALRMDNEALELVTPADEGGNVQPDYIPNVYCTTNFLPDNLNIWGDERDGAITGANSQNYFFMNPKIQEVCEVTYAQWDAFNLCFTVPSISGFDGAFYVGWGYNVLGDLRNSLQDEHIYKFQAIVQRSDKDSYGPKNITTPYAGFTVYPVDLDVTEGSGHDITTAINTVSVNGEVKSVKYVNVAGMVSDKPFSGVNIVVTEYTDGSRTTSKMLRK